MCHRRNKRICGGGEGVHTDLTACDMRAKATPNKKTSQKGKHATRGKRSLGRGDG